MTSKSSSVRSVRLQNDLWAWLEAEAARRSVSANGLISDLLEVGRLRAEEAKTAPKPPVARKVETAKPPPFTSRLKGEWKAP
jgi:hypothetical protein